MGQTMKHTRLERKEIIEQRLMQALAPVSIEVIDESHRHVGHEGAKTGASHFAVSIVTHRFAGLSAIQRHQLVYAALQDLIPHDIHALKIQAKMPEDLLKESAEN